MKALVLHATGINRDLDAKNALQMAGLPADIVHINELKTKEKKTQRLLFVSNSRWFFLC